MEDATAGGEPAGGTTAVSVELAQLIESFPEEDERILEAFLSVKGNVNDAIAHYKEVKKWREEIGPVGIKDVEQYLRSDTYMTTLEYPGCEERKHPPIIFLNGMIRGKKEEMIKQVIYCVERAWACMPPGPCRVKFVVNTHNRSFRFPDATYRAAVFSVMRFHYPWLINCKVLFLDVPSIIAAGLTAVGKIFDKVMTDRFQLCSSAAWTEADDDVKAFVEACPKSHALSFGANRAVSYDVDALITLRKAHEENKPASWDGEGGLMASVQMFAALSLAPTGAAGEAIPEEQHKDEEKAASSANTVSPISVS